MTWNNMREQQSQTADGAFAGTCLARVDVTASVGDDGLWDAPSRVCAWGAPASGAACGVGCPGGQRQAGRQQQARRSCAAVRQACGAVHRRRYDTYFAAHEVPGQIDYPLQVPVDDTLQGIDYVQVWLDQLLSEARYAASFTFESSVAVIERACSDYRGLHVSLCDLLQAHEDELARRPAQMAQNGQ